MLLGTLYPLVLDALGLGKISVGPPYFDTVFVPLMAPLVSDGRARCAGSRPRCLTSDASALGAGVSSSRRSLSSGHRRDRCAGDAGPALAFWVIAATFTDLAERGGKYRRAPEADSRAMVGMMVAHVGIAVFIIGVTMVKGHEVERDVKMDVGDSTTVRDVTFTFKGVSEVQGPNYVAARGSIEVSRDGRVLREMNPEKRMYRVQTNPMTEAAIATGLTGDLYVSLGEPVEGSSGAWIVRVYVKPFVDLDLGRLPADGLRRPARRQRPALPRQGEERETVSAAGGGRLMKYPRPHPAGPVPGAGWLPGRRPEPQPARGAVAADRQVAPGFDLTHARRARPEAKRDELLGKVWVLNVWASWCALPRGAPAGGGTRTAQAGAGLWPELQGTRAPPACLPEAAGQPLRGFAVRRRRPRRHRLRCLTACPRPSSSTSGHHPLKQIGPLTPEVIEKKIVPLLKELNV